MKAKVILLLCLLLNGFFLRSQTPFTLTYTFGSNGNVSSFTYNGISYEGVLPANLLKVGVTSTSSSNNFRATDWPTGAISGNDNFTGSVDLDKYIGLTVNAKNGYEITISSITFGLGRSATGVRQWEWRGNNDNYSSILNNYSNLASGLTNTNGVLQNIDANSSWVGNILNLGTEYANISTSASFRLYGYNAEAVAGTSGLQGVITIKGTYVNVAPQLTINTPLNGQNIYSQNVSVGFSVSNFVLNTDGKIAYSIDGGAVSYITESNYIQFTDLSYSTHTVYMELVDMDNNPLTNPVNKSITFTCKATPQLSIDSPSADERICGNAVNINFTETGFEIGTDGKIKYTVDGLNPLYNESGNAINLTDLTYGNHTVVLELVNMDNLSISPSVTSSISFTCIGAPTFAQLGPYCLGVTPASLELVSSNGINGTWSPLIISTEAVGIETYTFTPDVGECPATATMNITVNDILTPAFTQLGPYCSGSTPANLELTSTNGVAGTWEPSTISTDVAGTITYTFTPNANQCAIATTMDIVINTTTVPVFTQLGSYCIGSTPASLDLTSTNGITGIWEPSIISTDAAGTTTYTFTPDAGQCSSVITMDVEVTGEVMPLFAQLGPYCIGSTPASLELTSTNGLTGTWEPSAIVTDASSITTYTFTPDACQCAVSTTMDISVVEKTTPTFTELGPYCLDATPASLELISLNGIEGTWTPSVIATDVVGTTTYTFTPNVDQCAVATTMDITINDVETPVFTQLGPYCSGATPENLVLISNNGITGTWYPSVINTDVAGTITYTFTPESGQCALVTTMNIVVNEVLIPEFVQLGSYCVGSTPESLELTSTNAVTGVWEPSTITTDVAGTITYTFTPAINQCASVTTMDIIINSKVTPSFTELGPYCVGATPDNFELTSINGITGTWSPTTILTDSEGTTTYTFTPNAGECAISTTMNIIVNDAIIPSFTQLGPYCIGATPDVLASTSNDGVAGTWNPSVISTDAEGTTTYTFTPNGGDCHIATTMDIAINSIVTPTFTQLGPYCSGSTPDNFELTSTNGITGTWEPSTIATDAVGTTTYTFTPNANQCAVTASMDITINETIITEFTQLGQYCVGDVPASLELTSINGVAGIWTPSTITTDVAGTTTYTFTPNAGQCATTKTMDVTVNAVETPLFTELGSYCIGATPAILELTSTNGINGTWEPSTIVTDVEGTTTYTFTPSVGQCAVVTTMDITINSIVTPTFTQLGPYCIASTPESLELTSTNGVAGTWEPSVILTDAAGTTTYTFTPDASQCATVVTMDIVVNSDILPNFAQLGSYCIGSTPESLELTSTNGITGTWEPSTIVTDAVGTITYAFTPALGQCAVSTTMDIVVNENVNPTFAQIAPYCLGDTPVDFNLVSTNGITGTWSPSVIVTDAVGTTTYTFTPNANQCANTTTMDIVINACPVVNYQLVTSNESLVDGGRYLFVGEKEGDYYALGWQKSSNRHAVPVTINNNRISLKPAYSVSATQDYINPYEVTLGQVGTEWTLNDALNARYMHPRTGDNNGLVLNNTTSNWTISINANGEASIVCTGAEGGITHPRNILRFNENTPLFSCYASGQSPVYLYKETDLVEPYLTISSPANNSTVSQNEVSISFLVENFQLGETTGKVEYKLNDGAASYTTTSPIIISGLVEGTNNITLRLVGSDEIPLTPVVSQSITINYVPAVPTLTISSPVNNATIYSQNVDIVFAVENFIIGEENGKIKYTVDGGTALEHLTTSPISLADLSYNAHTILLELVDNTGSSLTPAVTANVSFTCAELLSNTYELVTSNDQLEAGRYLLVGVKNSAYHALGWQKSSNRHAVSVSVVDNEISVAPARIVTTAQDDVFPYEITFENNSGQWVLYDALNSKYLHPRTGENNGLVLNNTISNWTISIDANGEATIVCTGAEGGVTHPRNILRFNENTPLFSCYSSGQFPVYLYKAQETTEPYLTIVSPGNNSIVTTNEVEVRFLVGNFELGETIGKVEYKLNGGAASYATTSPITISDLVEGSNTIELQLVDNDNSPIVPAVTKTITVNYEYAAPVLTITSPANNANIYSQNVNISFTVENYNIGETAGKIKYVVDGGTTLQHNTTNPISLTGLSLGEHTVSLELVDNMGSPLNPVVISSVTFTCLELETINYRLVTSNAELEDGAKYLFVGIKNDSHYALGWQKASNRNGVPVNTNGAIISVAPAQEVTLVQDDINPYEITLGVAGTEWTLFDGLNGKYLHPRTGDSNGLVLNSTTANWAISIAEGGVASAVCTGAEGGVTYPRNIMRFNTNGSNMPLFGCYSSGQIDFYLYKALSSVDPYLVITSPEDNSTVTTNQVELEFVVGNFDLGTAGKVEYKLNSGTPLYATSSPITISGLALGANTISLQLVDNSNNPLSPVVSESLNITYTQLIPELTIISPEHNSSVFSSQVEIVFSVSNFEIGETAGKIRYSLNGENYGNVMSADHATLDPIQITLPTLDTYTIEMELIDNIGNPISPSVVVSVSFRFEDVSVGVDFEDKVLIYPNPANDFINIELPEGTDNVHIMNIVGQTLVDIKPNSNVERINLENFEPGVYFVKVSKSLNSKIFKIVVN